MVETNSYHTSSASMSKRRQSRQYKNIISSGKAPNFSVNRQHDLSGNMTSSENLNSESCMSISSSRTETLENLMDRLNEKMADIVGESL